MNNQSEPHLQLPESSGGRYKVRSHIATWQHRSNDEKIIDLSFRRKRFEVTREGSGPNGRPRMLINGIRKPDGKLFQGRSLLELVRELDRHFNDFVEMPARLQRIERKLDVLVAAASPRIAKTKLCCEMVTANWPQERYVPKASLGGFARLPLPSIPASQLMAAGEFRTLLAILFCAQGTGLLTAGKKRLAKIAKVEESDVKHYLRSLSNRQLVRRTGRVLEPYRVNEYELLTHPWLCDVENLSNGGEKSAKGGEFSAERGGTVPPLKTIKKIDDKKINRQTINRPQEEELLSRLHKLCSSEEMKKNGPGWRTWIREDSRALRAAIDDLAVRRDNYHLGHVRNPGAYINERYQFYHTKNSRSDEAMTDLSPDKSLSEVVRESISQAATELPA